jgi:hypothetical protein
MIPSLKLKAARTAEIAASRLQHSAATAEVDRLSKVVRNEARTKLAAMKSVSSDTQELVTTLESAGATREEINVVVDATSAIFKRLEKGVDVVEAAAYPRKVAKAQAKAAKLEAVAA